MTFRYLNLVVVKLSRPRFTTTFPRSNAPTPQAYTIMQLHAPFSRATTTLHFLSVTPSHLLPGLVAPLSVLAGLPSMPPPASTCLCWIDRVSCTQATLMPPAISVLHVPSKCLTTSPSGWDGNWHAMVDTPLLQIPGTLHLPPYLQNNPGTYVSIY